MKRAQLQEPPVGERKRRWLRRRVFWGIIVFVALGTAFLYLTEIGQRLRDRAQMAVRHVNRQFYDANGWPLPGTPDLTRLTERLQEKGLKRGDPVFLRLFKRDMQLELWMKRGDRFVLFATYPICTWSGQLGPKQQEGDHQAPEGFYTVSKTQLNPNSHWHRSFDLGFPNLYDRAHGRTGGYLMVHGGCASVGCYAMTNPVIDEIWQLVTAAMNGGQERFAVHIFPFRLNDAHLSAYRGNPWEAFWRELKPGYDLFEVYHIPPQISVCDKHYVVEPDNGATGTAPALRTTSCRFSSSAGPRRATAEVVG
jgi:murein L,D-transpeptidase YafK